MDRALPIFNRLVVERQAQQTFDIHRKHLEQIKRKEIRTQADTRSQTGGVPAETQQPVSAIRTTTKAKEYLIVDRKAILLEKERRIGIEKANVILLNKMSKIMTQKPQFVKSTEAGNFSQHPQTLNRQNRVRQILRIADENKQILNRLRGQKSLYSAERYRSERTDMEKVLKNICKYKLPQTNQQLQQRGCYTAKQSVDLSADNTQRLYNRYSSGSAEQEINLNFEEVVTQQPELIPPPQQAPAIIAAAPNSQSKLAVLNRKARHDGFFNNYVQALRAATSAGKRGQLQAVNGSTQSEKKNSTILHQQHVTLNEKQMDFELTKQSNSTIVLSLFECESRRLHKLILPEQQGREFLSYYGNDYRTLIQSLHIVNEQILLKAPPPPAAITKLNASSCSPFNQGSERSLNENSPHWNKLLERLTPYQEETQLPAFPPNSRRKRVPQLNAAAPLRNRKSNPASATNGYHNQHNNSYAEGVSPLLPNIGSDQQYESDNYELLDDADKNLMVQINSPQANNEEKFPGAPSSRRSNSLPNTNDPVEGMLTRTYVKVGEVLSNKKYKTQTDQQPDIYQLPINSSKSNLNAQKDDAGRKDQEQYEADMQDYMQEYEEEGEGENIQNQEVDEVYKADPSEENKQQDNFATEQIEADKNLKNAQLEEQQAESDDKNYQEEFESAHEDSDQEQTHRQQKRPSYLSDAVEEQVLEID